MFAFKCSSKNVKAVHFFCTKSYASGILKASKKTLYSLRGSRDAHGIEHTFMGPATRLLGVSFSLATRPNSAMGSGNSKEKGSNNAKNDDIIEGVVCQESDLIENQMKSFDLEERKVLVVKQKGQIYAVGNKCTHYGAPLETGALGDAKVRCPWHGACFSLKTGDIEDFPGLDSLPCFSVEVQKDGGVKVRGSRKQLAAGRRQKCMVSLDSADKRVFIIAGGGAAAQVCAETLRQEGFEGRVIMLCQETFMPYDRTKLSKALDNTADKLALRPSEFYKNTDIELKLGVALAKLDTTQKVAHLSAGAEIRYDSIFLATGSKARTLNSPSSNLKNVFVLRNVDGANLVAKSINADKNVVIIGASFVGMEFAAYCDGKAKTVTVVGNGSVPFEPVLGKKIGLQIKKMYEQKGVKITLGSNVTELLPSDSDPSSVGQVKLANGDVLPADIVMAAIGAVPNTDYLQNDSVEMGPGKTISVNEFLESKISGVFAGGDIAHAPVLGTVASIGHWQLAQYHGRIAGLNMLGKRERLNAVPFFWTTLYNKGIRYAGFAPGFDDVVLHGDLEELKFIAYYCKGESVFAVATCGNDPVASHYANHLAAGRTLSKQQIVDDPTAWINK